MKEFPPFKLDPANQCLWRSADTGSDERIELRPKTFDVLLYLVDNPGRLITHEELLDELWHGADVYQGVLKGHVLAIRKALNDTAEEPRYILTLRKRGYKFIAPVRFDEAPGKQSRATLGKFVGRTQLLSDLREAFRLARNSDPQLVFVAGEAGIGKTELVERFLEDVGRDEHTFIAVGRCIEGYGGIEPYYPVLEAMTSLTRHRNGDAIVQALKTVAPTWAVQLPDLLTRQTRASLHHTIAASSRERMVREFCDLIDKLAERRTVVLVLEDLHWSDYSTVDLLSALGRRRRRARVLIIATYRLEDAAANDHPIRRLSRELLVQKIGTRLTLPPLGPEAVTEFVSSAVKGAEAQRLANLIAQHSSGNPLLMIATLETFIERGLIVASADGFRLCVPVAELTVEISSVLSEVLESRISQFDEREQSALAAASVVGMTFDPATAAPACAMTGIEFELVCETLVRNGKCISQAGPQRYPDGTLVREYTFKHVLYRRAFYERQGPIRLAHSHRVISEALEQLHPPGARRQIALQLLEHLAGCGEWHRALHYLREARKTNRARHAYRDGLELFRLGSGLAKHLPEHERVEVEMEMLEGKAGIYAAIRDPEAFACYEELAALARERDLVDVRARALIGMTYTIGWLDNVRSRALLQEALEISEAQQDPLMRARTELSVYQGLISLDGWDDDYAGRCTSALQVLKSGPDKLDAAWALVEHSLLDAVAGRYREAYRAVSDDFPTLIDTEVRSGMNVARMYYNACLVSPWALFFLGELGPALKKLDDSIPAMRTDGNDYSARILQLVHGWFLVYVGDYQRALADCLSVIENGTPEGGSEPVLNPLENRIYLLVRGAAERGLGNFDRAHELFAERDRLVAEAPVSLDWYWSMIAEYETTDLYLAMEDSARAEAHARLLLSSTLKTSERTLQALAWNALAEVQLLLGEPQAALESIRHAFSVAQGYETHLATWRVHSTAARAHQMLQQVVEAENCRELSDRASGQLLSTFAQDDPAHAIFEKRIASVRKSNLYVDHVSRWPGLRDAQPHTVGDRSGFTADSVTHPAGKRPLR